MATLIEQHPLYTQLTVGQDVIFTVSNTSVVSSFTGVKFIAEVHISSTFAPNPSTSTDIVGTFKTTPNNAGVGMFDFRPIIESFVNADNLARQGSAYKTVVNTANSNVPMHLIDKFSGNVNSMRYLFIRFKIEYIDTSGNLVTTDIKDSDIYQLLNGYLKYTDVLDLVGNDFGYNLSSFNLNGSSKSFLTNAPTTQYANLEDYGTVSLWMFNAETPSNLDGTVSVEVKYFDSDGVYISYEEVYHTAVNGGYDSYNGYIGMNLLFFGCFPANLQGSSTMFQNLVSAGTIQGGHYELVVHNDAGQVMSSIYTVNLNCPTLKGYDPIRLTWLNQWGTWDYYTFTMKSSKMISTKGSTYQQLAGSWNESAYRIDSFKGGKKSFRVNATEKITMNTDFVNESESEWFEELINSPEVYILKGHQSETPYLVLNQYVTPVRLTTSSYTKKTVANDRLMQYTFEVEKAKTLRTQSV